jgi:hypothetical protein
VDESASIRRGPVRPESSSTNRSTLTALPSWVSSTPSTARLRGVLTKVIIAGHAFIQNLRRGHYDLGIDAPPAMRVATAFTELANAI